MTEPDAQLGESEANGYYQRLRSSIDGYRASALLSVAARVGIPRLLSESSLPAEQIAVRLETHAPSVLRLLRGLAAMGICSEEEGGKFGLTPMGKLLREDDPNSLYSYAIIAGEEYIPAWAKIHHTVTSGEAAFNHVFGVSPWKHRQEHPDLNTHFNSWLNNSTAETAQILAGAYDFDGVGAIMDVGGGQGALLAAILGRYPEARGVLFEQPHVVTLASHFFESDGCGSRCRMVAGDFFERIPHGAQTLILKSVIHDWDDECSLLILKNCRKALEKTGRLLLIERILPTRAQDDAQAIMVDLQMMVVTGGRERSKEEYRRLMEAAGFWLNRVIPTPSGFNILEGAPV